MLMMKTRFIPQKRDQSKMSLGMLTSRFESVFVNFQIISKDFINYGEFFKNVVRITSSGLQNVISLLRLLIDFKY